jgi:hypothetical protein
MNAVRPGLLSRGVSAIGRPANLFTVLTVLALVVLQGVLYVNEQWYRRERQRYELSLTEQSMRETRKLQALLGDVDGQDDPTIRQLLSTKLPGSYEPLNRYPMEVVDLPPFSHIDWVDPAHGRQIWLRLNNQHVDRIEAWPLNRPRGPTGWDLRQRMGWVGLFGLILAFVALGVTGVAGMFEERRRAWGPIGVRLSAVALTASSFWTEGHALLELSGVVFVAALALAAWRVPQNKREPHCWACGYDLRGTAGAVCSECGAPVNLQGIL